MNNGYGYFSNTWALDTDIKNELGLLLVLSSRSAIDGFVYANNNYFADLFNCTKEQISKRLKKLKDKGYIKIEYIYKGKEVVSRKIYVVKDYINIQNSEEPKEEVKKEFIKPTVEEIDYYLYEQRNRGKQFNFTAEQFYTYYEGVNWKRGKTKIVNWKNVVQTWIAKEAKEDSKVRSIYKKPKNNLSDFFRVPKY